ncbi:MAG: hypothetical protein R3B09_23475 [Nannocystaceae bacterium]
MDVLRLVPRLIYFAVVPFCLIAAAMVLPLSGLIIDLALLLLGLVLIEALRGLSERYRLVRAITRRQRAFAEFYQANPPHSFAYYVFFPLLLPIVLARRSARAELSLYRGFTRVGLLVLVGHACLDYATAWAPDLPFDEFLGATLGTLFLQWIALLGFIIPLAATVVHYHLQAKRRTVRLLLGVAALSVGVAFLGMMNLRRAEVPVETVKRVEIRTEVHPDQAAAAQDAALVRLWADLESGAATLEEDGLVDDAATARAQGALIGFYRADEAAAFTAHAWPVDAPTVAILQVRQPRDRPPVWRARGRDGRTITDKAEVPAEIYDARATTPRHHR